MLLNIPLDITTHITDFLWGNTLSWKAKFSQVIKLFNYKNDLMGNLTNQGDYCETYCSKCGEKELFPFTRTICFDCEPIIHKYPFNTFSGGNQGCFYLHHTRILLYRDLVHKYYFPRTTCFD